MLPSECNQETEERNFFFSRLDSRTVEALPDSIIAWTEPCKSTQLSGKTILVHVLPFQDEWTTSCWKDVSLIEKGKTNEPSGLNCMLLS